MPSANGVLRSKRPSPSVSSRRLTRCGFCSSCCFHRVVGTGGLGHVESALLVEVGGDGAFHQRRPGDEFQLESFGHRQRGVVGRFVNSGRAGIAERKRPAGPAPRRGKSEEIRISWIRPPAGSRNVWKRLKHRWARIRSGPRPAMRMDLTPPLPDFPQRDVLFAIG